MAKVKWWMCEGCRSLNDLPANKCYKCRAGKPANPTLLDDQYGQVNTAQRRVGITVDLSRIGELTARDPRETEHGGGAAFEVYGAMDDQPLESVRRADEPKAPPPPLREPRRRSIAEVGGLHWTDGLTGVPDPEIAPHAEDAAEQVMPPPPAGFVPPPPVGQVPPPVQAGSLPSPRPPGGPMPPPTPSAHPLGTPMDGPPMPPPGVLPPPYPPPMGRPPMPPPGAPPPRPPGVPPPPDVLPPPLAGPPLAGPPLARPPMPGVPPPLAGPPMPASPPRDEHTSSSG